MRVDLFGCKDCKFSFCHVQRNKVLSDLALLLFHSSSPSVNGLISWLSNGNSKSGSLSVTHALTYMQSVNESIGFFRRLVNSISVNLWLKG